MRCKFFEFDMFRPLLMKIAMVVLLLCGYGACDGGKSEPSVEQASETSTHMDGTLAEKNQSDSGGVEERGGEHVSLEATKEAATDDGLSDEAKEGAVESAVPEASSIPRLGMYTIKVDGTELRLLRDTGTRQFSHIRLGPKGWLTATRYNDDKDGNGLAMEAEGGGTAYYNKTEVVIFKRDTPHNVTVIAGGTPGQLCANSSWTRDGKLLFLHQDDPTIPGRSRFKRITFSTIPNIATFHVVDVPSQILPVDPEQWGPSDQNGKIVFPGSFKHPKGYMRPIWEMSAAGTTNRLPYKYVQAVSF